MTPQGLPCGVSLSEIHSDKVIKFPNTAVLRPDRHTLSGFLSGLCQLDGRAHQKIIAVEPEQIGNKGGAVVGDGIATPVNDGVAVHVRTRVQMGHEIAAVLLPVVRTVGEDNRLGKVIAGLQFCGEGVDHIAFLFAADIVVKKPPVHIRGLNEHQQAEDDGGDGLSKGLAFPPGCQQKHQEGYIEADSLGGSGGIAAKHNLNDEIAEEHAEKAGDQPEILPLPGKPEDHQPTQNTDGAENQDRLVAHL